MTAEPEDEPRGGWTPEPDDQHDQGGGVRHHRPSWWRRWGRGGRFVETWIPESMRDARVDPGRRGALVLSLVAALAAVAAAVGVWRDRPEPRPVQTISQSAFAAEGSTAVPGTALPGTGATDTAAAGTAVPGRAPRVTGGAVRSGAEGPSTGARPPAVLAVSVTGAVRHPGLVRVPAGSRVADAIAAAGGVTAEGDITGLNVATVLADGDSVVVAVLGAVTPPGVPGGAGPSRSSAPGSAAGGAADPGPGTGGGQVDLNTADSAALEELPGVGPVMAGNIIAWRDANGPFTSVDQLQEISGIGPARFAQLAPLVVVG